MARVIFAGCQDGTARERALCKSERLIEYLDGSSNMREAILTRKGDISDFMDDVDEFIAGAVKPAKTARSD